MHWDALRAQLGAAAMDYGQRISAADARRVACDCKLIPVVLGGDSEPLDVGRATRTAPRGIRRALAPRASRIPGARHPCGPLLLKTVCEASFADRLDVASPELGIKRDFAG